MKKIFTTSTLILLSLGIFAQQGFFLDDWTEKTSVIPVHTEVTKTSSAVEVNISVNYTNEITKVSPYLFGHCVSQFYGNYYAEPKLLENIQNLNPSILRYPAGSGSNKFFWNRDENDGIPADANISDYKYGISSEADYMTNENFYTLRGKTNSKGMNVVNYSYARYGTSADPVAVAAKLAADWVIYDNGRTKFREIGNENYGAWEVGYEIDVSQNQDGQPEIQTGTLYGQHFKVFAAAMRQAASDIGVEIKIGAVCYSDNENNNYGTWNDGVIKEVGNVADFLIVHKYFRSKNYDASILEVLDEANT